MAKNFRAQNDDLSEAEAANRRDELLKRMLNTPPKPRKAKPKPKPKKPKKETPA